MAQLAQCELAAAKTEATNKMIEEELKNYAKLSETIEKSIDLAKQQIEESKQQLLAAKQIRKNKMEYDLLAKIIREEPDRKETAKQIEVLEKELAELVEKKVKLERKFQKRRNNFAVLMYSIRQLETQLEDDSSTSESEAEEEEEIDSVNDVNADEKSDVESVNSRVANSRSAAASTVQDNSDGEEEFGEKTVKRRLARESEMEIKPDTDSNDNKMETEEDEESKEPLSVEEDAVLELSIENDVKMDDNAAIAL